MAQFIDEALWRDALKHPDWYLRIADDFKRLEKLAAQERDEGSRTRIKAEVYGIVQESLLNGSIPLATSGEDLDKERRPIDTIVIHHTGSKPGMTLERLNATQLLRIYGTYYANPTDPREKHFKGQPVWSNHFYKGKQVFWGYHWLIRGNGIAEQILDDEYVGWHAGDWDVNTRSIGICIDDNLTKKHPKGVVLASIAAVIKKHYLLVKPEKVLGHRDVLKSTVCPGDLFHEHWKSELLDLLV